MLARAQRCASSLARLWDVLSTQDLIDAAIGVVCVMFSKSSDASARLRAVMVVRWFATTTAPKETTTMTVVKLRPALAEIKSLLSADKDFLKPLVRTVLQEVLDRIEGLVRSTLGSCLMLARRVALAPFPSPNWGRWRYGVNCSSQYLPLRAKMSNTIPIGRKQCPSMR